MSKDLIFQGDGAQLPDHLRQYSERTNKAASLVTSFNSLPRLSIRGKQFRLTKNEEEVAYPMGQALEVVILAADPEKGMAKSFYAGSYSKDSDEMPDCFSSDGLTPDSFVEAPKCRSCAECPNNVFGSGTDSSGNPSKGKACSDHKNLFVVEASELDQTIYVMRVPATSLKSLSQYGRKLSKHNLEPEFMVTALSFTDDEHPQLIFDAKRYCTADEVKITVARSDSDELGMALPSKNKLDAPAQAQLPPGEPAVLELPSPPPAEPEYVMTAKAKGATLEAFYAKNWTDEMLIKQGYMEQKQ